MRVEHWVAQSADPTQDLVWGNLLAVCPGQGQPPPPGTAGRADHCDRVRGNRPLHVHPAGPHPVDRLFRYRANGDVISDHAGAAADIEVLNLRHWRLRANRTAVVDQLRRELGAGHATTAVLGRRLVSWTTPDAHDRLREYAGVAEYYLRRWIARRP